MKVKKISLILISIMLITICFSNTIFAVTAQDNGRMKISITTEGYEESTGNGNYTSGGFDIKGYSNDGQSLIATTFENRGYNTYLNVNGISGAMDNVLDDTDESKDKIRDMLYLGTGTQRINGIDLNVETSFVNEGNVKVTYTLKNTTAVQATYSLATIADIEIDGTDHPTVTKRADGVFSAYTEDGNLQKPVEFIFYGKNMTGVTNVDRVWMGDRYDGYIFNMFMNTPDFTLQVGDDSSFCYSWINRTIGAGETKTHSVIMTIGELNPPIVTLTTTNNKIFATNDNVIIDGTVKDLDLVDTATIKYKVNGGTEITQTPNITMNGTTKNFSIDLTTLELAKNTMHSIEVWAIDSDNNISNKVSISFKITDNSTPTPTNPTNSTPTTPTSPTTPTNQEQENETNTNNGTVESNANNAKDNTPKTGMTSYVGIAAIITALSVVGIITIKKRKTN